MRQLGRVFSPDDNAPGIAEVVVISDAMWKRRFGAAPDAIGRKLRIDGDWYTVVGVMPPEFRHPGRSLRTDVELWVPSGFIASPFPKPARGAYFLAGAIARLKPGISMPEARQRLDAFAKRVKTEFPADYTIARQLDATADPATRGCRWPDRITAPGSARRRRPRVADRVRQHGWAAAGACRRHASASSPYAARSGRGEAGSCGCCSPRA